MESRTNEEGVDKELELFNSHAKLACNLQLSQKY